ncbi:putative vacuolar protein-sorting-associated protein [Xylogone sp. PMI_703]|nr:putative vacuolar protein-sorting-associated protein [Xylogone sp. PMI_703]
MRSMNQGSTTLTTTANSPFKFPREYYFPPFFTRQPISTTFHAQTQKWATLILAYCRAHKLWKLSLIDALDTELFWNKAIGKKMSLNDAREIVDFMRKDGRAEWVGATSKGTEGEKNVAWIYWRNPEEWAGVIADWVDETAQKNTVLTLYELAEGEATISQEFHGMDPDLLQKALNVLVKRGKAQIFGQEDQQGVKFF